MTFSKWDQWMSLIGEWKGENTGAPGQGEGSFTFSLDLDGNVLVRKSSTSFPDTLDRPAFTHIDWTFHYAEMDGKHAIYFDNEGHTIRYDVTENTVENSIILTSPVVTGAPRFRFTYIKKAKDSMLTRFEMTPPGKPNEFQVYLEGPVQKVK